MAVLSWLLTNTEHRYNKSMNKPSIIEIGSIVKINETLAKSATCYNVEDRFEVCGMDEKEGPRSQVYCRIISSKSNLAYDIFPIYMLELA